YRSADRGASWAPITARKPAASAPKKRAPARRSTVRRTGSQSPASSRRVTAPSKPAQASTAARLSDDIVRRVQQALERAGYEIGTPDGQLGPRTIAAVKRFETDRYLAVPGQLDE